MGSTAGSSADTETLTEVLLAFAGDFTCRLFRLGDGEAAASPALRFFDFVGVGIVDVMTVDSGMEARLTYHTEKSGRRLSITGSR